jgi:hypothetical protein
MPTCKVEREFAAFCSGVTAVTERWAVEQPNKPPLKTSARQRMIFGFIIGGVIVFIGFLPAISQVRRHIQALFARSAGSAAFMPLQLPHDQPSSNLKQFSILKRRERRAPKHSTM